MISVVIAAWRAGPALGSCLDSLRGQPVEVIVVGDASLAAHYPEVRWLPASGRLFPGDARNRGLQHASHPLIALLDADCRVPADWALQVGAAHRGEPRVVAHALAPPTRGGAVAWAAWFCKCARWAPQTPAGPRADLPSATMSFPREVFEQCGPFLEGTFSSDTAFCWAARRRGYALWFEPSLAVCHDYTPAGRAFLDRQWSRGREFARVRRRHGSGWSPPGLLWPLVAWVLFARLCALVARHRVHRLRFAAVWPFVLAGLVAWAAGEGSYRE